MSVCPVGWRQSHVTHYASCAPAYVVSQRASMAGPTIDRVKTSAWLFMPAQAGSYWIIRNPSYRGASRWSNVGQLVTPTSLLVRFGSMVNLTKLRFVTIHSRQDDMPRVPCQVLRALVGHVWFVAFRAKRVRCESRSRSASRLSASAESVYRPAARSASAARSALW